ncbi:hypothetical protein IWW47_005225 [Coemansia sp. RSA 2052]|nr:hypothetical protein IWW47_005225 [Coemansia sp. RSA 2052]
MSIWKEFEYLGLPVSGSGYGVVARAHIKAGKHKSAETLFVEMVNRGIPHNEITAALWIESRLIQNDASGALKILGAIGNPTRCAALALGNSCFNSLDMAQRTARQFSVVIRYYLARGDVSNASAVMSAMHKCELTMTSKLYAELLRQLAQNGSHDAFVDTMRQMVTAGVPINPLLMDTFREYSSNRKAMASTSVDDASQV